ncbi:uncharacterized protein LOC144480175 [Mustelus asterias]
MRTLLLILSFLVADSTTTDPCRNHTVLDQSWRSTDCKRTECANKWKCDLHLCEGWYRFKSSGGWKIPETVVPVHRCSTAATGWLNGSHPTVEQGEVNMTVCFNWDGNYCNWDREIKIKNCSSYFVYELKPPRTSWSAYCTEPSSALMDPCVNHTVLDQSWRSIDCSETECSGQLKCDDDLVYGWYRFESSGGWKIPDTVVATHHCSTNCSGWLDGLQPTMEQGEVNRTVCFNWGGNRCYWNREIKIKNCSSYLVYELKPTPGCEAAYCTVTDSAVVEPCVNHTVLEHHWRSMHCAETGCGGPKCDNKLNHGWYRFKSSGGWQIPETEVPERHCSTHAPGWLNGSHPTMEQGIVTRTVCLSWNGNACNLVHEIKIKRCNGYFVYELKSLHHCAAYCTVSKHETIEVEVTSVGELDDETAKKIIAKRVQQTLKDQCPSTNIALEPDDVQCWDVDS